MAFTLTSLKDATGHGFDTVIDVRSPAEFAEDHVPGAISLPVLSDEERARVGTIYVQESPFTARKIGAALVARNAARHIEEALFDKDGAWRPLVYCWRGGQRSGSFASILSQIGWRAETVAGGYQSFRRLVVCALYDDPWPAPVILLDGYTGTAKTDVLKELGRRGVQIIDLEGRARHRGSVLGPLTERQPSQKSFETQLAMDLVALDPSRPVVIEAESSKVGDLLVPPSLWKAMRGALRVTLSAPVDARAAYLARAYGDVTGDLAAFGARLDKLIPYHGRAVIATWRKLLADGAHVTLAADLVERHYDPRYAKKRDGRDVIAEVSAERLDDRGIAALAREVEAVISGVSMR